MKRLLVDYGRLVVVAFAAVPTEAVDAAGGSFALHDHPYGICEADRGVGCVS